MFGCGDGSFFPCLLSVTIRRLEGMNTRSQGASGVGRVRETRDSLFWGIRSRFARICFYYHYLFTVYSGMDTTDGGDGFRKER